MTDNTVNTMTLTTKLRAFSAGLALALLCAACASEPAMPGAASPILGAEQVASSYIVQASSLEAAAAAVEAVGGEITHELGVIRAVGATLLPAQVETLKRRSDVRKVFADMTVKTSSI